MHPSLHHPSIDADETIPEAGFAAISDMIAETLLTIGEEKPERNAWPDVLAPQQRAPRDIGFTKTF